MTSLTMTNHRHHRMGAGDLATLLIGGCVYLGVLVAVFLI